MENFKITKPEETDKEYYVRGMPDAIQKDVFSVLKDMKEFRALKEEDLKDLDTTAYIISSLLIISEAQASSKDDITYTQFNIIKNTPFTCDIKKVSLSLLSQIIYAGIKIGVLPLLGPLGIYIDIGIGMFGLPGLLNSFSTIHRVNDNQFCVLMAAHQKESNTLFTSNDIYNELHDKVHNIICPYSYIYNRTYHEVCTNLSPQGVCMLNKDDIHGILCSLAPGQKYGIEQLGHDQFKRL